MKTNQLFERLWEHGRTLRRVGLVLVMCLTLGVTHAYALDLYLDISAADWSASSAVIKVWPGTGSDVTGSRVGTAALYKFTVSSATGTMYFKRDNPDGGNWNQVSVSYDSSYEVYKLTGWGDKEGSGNCTYATYHISTTSTNNYIYFDNTQTNWSNSNRYFIIGHDNPTKYSKKYSMSAIGHTKLWYVGNTSDSWKDVTYYGVINPTSAWGSDTDWGSDNLSNGNNYTAAYTSQRNLNSGKTVLFTPASGSNGAALSISSDMSSYTGLNYSQTVKKYTSTDGGSTYSAASINSGTVTINPYKMTGNGTASNSSNTGTINTAGTTSVSKDAVYTGEVALTASNNTGYDFVGWFEAESGGSAVSTNTSYTYNAPKSTKTIYARFKAHTYSLSLDAQGGGSGSSSATVIYSTSTVSSITNPTKAGYVFAGWYSASGGLGTMVIDAYGHLQPNSAYTDASGNWIATADKTLYAGWLTVHTPGTYEGTYGKLLTIYNCEPYELYGVSKTNSSTTYRLTAGEKVAVTTDYSTAPNKVLTYNSTTLVRDGWLEGNHNGNGSGGALNSNEFFPFPTSSTYHLTMQNAQYLQFCVNGYSGFSIIAKDCNTSDKYFKVEIDGTADESVSKYSSGNGSIRTYSLSPSNTNHIVKITAIGGNTSDFYAFSLKVDDGYPKPSAFSCSSVTSSSATLSITDSYDTNDYEFYYSTSNGAPSAGTSATTTSTSKTPTITGLSAETKYYIWVRSICPTNSSTKSAWKALSGDYFTTNAASTTYAVSVEANDDDYGTVETALDELAEDETTTITATPETGYWVTEWAVDDGDNGAELSDDGSTHSNTTTLTMGTADATVTVTFALKDFDVDYNTPSNGNYTTKVASGSATSEDKTANMGQTVALVATPSSGYAFASWTITNTDTDTDITSTLLTGSKSTTASTSFTMPAANISIVATFAKTYTIEKGTYTNGDFTIATSPAVSGAKITLTATPSSGYVFEKWVIKKTSDGSDVTASVSVNNVNVASTTFTMPSYAVTVDAVFKATPNIYYYKDGTHYVNSAYKNPAGGAPAGTAGSSNNNNLTTPWKMCNACVTGVDSVVVTNGQYDNKGNHVNAYIKLATGGGATDKNVIFGISTGYTAVISVKIGGYSSNPSVTLKKNTSGSLGSDIPKTTGYATVGGVATKENNFKELRWSALEAGVYVLNVGSNNAYISEIDIQTTPKVYTLTFDADDASRVGSATNKQSNVTVTFDNNNFSAATVKVPVLTGYTFGGYYTAVDGGGVQIVDENGDWQSSKTNYLDASGNWIKAANTTLYAKWTANNYRVNFDANSGICGLSYMTVAMGATYGSGTEGGPLDGELPTASKYGYHFVGWYTLPSGGTEVTKSTQMTTASEHTIYAHYEERTYVYFYNNLGWTNVFVTYDAYWDAGGLGSGNYEKIYHQMELVDGTTNIYRDEVPSSVLKSWKYFICFNDTKMLVDKDVPTESGDYGNYYGGNAVYRRDFDSYATMFVPYQAKGDGEEHNTTYYWSTKWWEDKSGDDVIDYRHQKGYWMKYNSSSYRSGYAGYVIKGSWDGEQNDYYFKRDGETSNDYTVTKYMEAGQTYNFRIYKHCTTTNTYSSWFTYNRGASAITSAGCTDLALSTNIAKSETSVKDQFTSTIAGDYTFKLTCDPNGTLKLSIIYPERTNDYFRAVYTWNDGSNHTRIYKTFKRIKNGGDTWFEAFVHKAASPIVSRSLKLQRYNTSTSAWEDVEGKTFDLSECTKNGLYSFTMTRSSENVITLRYVGPYTGTIYLRSDVTAGGWDYYNYASYGNSVMTYSDFSKHQTQNPYSHYYCVYVDNDKTNVAFTIATSNTPSICDTLVGDATIGAAAGGTPNYKALPTSNPANIRFMYNDSLNTISRAYLKSAQGESVNKRFLVLHGDSKMFDSNGDAIAANASRELAANEMEFTDKGNWVYEISLKAEPVAKAKVIAKYNGSDRYLIGGSGDTSADWKTILGGDVTTTKYALAGTYDFKTNRLLLAWTPDGSDITANISDVDMLWVRHADNPATQIKFNGGSLTNISVVGAIQFRYDDLVGRVGSWNETTRPYLKFFVSFPFDVNVSNIFGLNEAEYGREYLIQRYNGAKRAKDGYFIADGVSFWETLTTDSVMHANEGYCVSMDNDYLNYVSGYGNIWKNKTSGSSVYLYFPANNKMSITASDGKTTTAEAHLSTRDKSYTSGGHSYNMKETDSHWNMVGAPYFSNAAVTDGPTSYYKWHPNNTWKPWLFSGDKGTEYEGVSNNFNAMSCIMVQYAGTITWNATTPPALAPRKRTGVEKSNLVALQLMQGGEQVDRAFIELKDGAETGFLLCEDLIKIFNNGRPNLYVHASEYATSYSQVPVESQTISIGVDIWNSGVYTFDMPSNFNGTAVLIDKFAQTRTNLSLENYEVYLDPGVIKDRFEVEINVNNAPTAIDGVTDGSGSLKDGKAHKFIMNGQMYILNEGVLYDATGKRVE